MPGRFARPQSSQQIGALPTCRQGGGSRQSIAEFRGVRISHPAGRRRGYQRYFAESCPFTTE